MSILPLAILMILTTIFVVRIYREFGRSKNNPFKIFGICVAAAGVFGFLGAFWIATLPMAFLDHFELPNMLGADHLTAPDGRVFIVSSPILRVQRYGPDGFERGFSYKRKAFHFGMSASGNVLICATGDELITYSPDGVEVPPRASCPQGVIASTSWYPSHAKVPAIAFNWFSALAVPLWHPIAGWLVAAFGGFWFWLASQLQSEASKR